MDEGEALYQMGMDLRYRGKAPSKLYRKKRILESVSALEEEARSMEALECFERSFKLGNAGGKYEFAIAILKRDFPVTKEFSNRYSNEAIDLLLEAADSGHRAAMIHVGMAELGYSFHLENPAYKKIVINPNNAIRRLELCIPDEGALCVLRDTFFDGYIIPQNISKALTYEFLRISLNPEALSRKMFSPSRIPELKSKLSDVAISQSRYVAEQIAGSRHQYASIKAL